MHYWTDWHQGISLPKNEAIELPQDPDFKYSVWKKYYALEITRVTIELNHRDY